MPAMYITPLVSGWYICASPCGCSLSSTRVHVVPPSLVRHVPTCPPVPCARYSHVFRVELELPVLMKNRNAVPPFSSMPLFIGMLVHVCPPSVLCASRFCSCAAISRWFASYGSTVGQYQSCRSPPGPTVNRAQLTPPS